MPTVDPTWSAARNGLPADSTATSHAAQVAQFLGAHGVIPIYQGNRAWAPATVSTTAQNSFFWVDPASVSGGVGWLPQYDVDQPVTGLTSVGRVTVAVQAVGSGADLQVALCPDNGSGSPNTASPIASTIVPASHLLALSAAGSLASAGPLATAQSNTALLGSTSVSAWTQPAISANGAATYACPVTSGNYTVLIGGYDATASAASGVVAAVQYLGPGALSGPMLLPSLPQPAWYLCAAATPDTMLVAGGINQASAHLTSVWAASWSPSSGSLGAWSAQQALPAASVNGAMAAWGDYAYVVQGSSDGSSANASAAMWWAAVSNGQVTAWNAGPSLPQALLKPYLAVVGNWLVLAGGVSTSGTTLTSTWYAAIGSDGTPGPWRPGPPLQPAFAFSPNWNLIVTDSAVIISSGGVGGGSSVYGQVLAVSPDGPAAAWELQDFGLLAVAADYQAAAYPSGDPGQWEAVSFGPASYTSAPLYPVPMISVPLPATGLTSGSTYHVVLRQLGGDALNNYLQAGEMVSGVPLAPWMYSARGSGGPWSTHAGHVITMDVWDAASGVQPLHLWEDSGARVTTLLWSGAGSQLLGVLESTAFPAGSPEAVIGPVSQLTYSVGGRPVAAVQLA